jgi:hypothetical protein
MRAFWGTAAAALLAACSGYGGGGDARIVPVSDAGTSSGGPTSSPGPAPSGSSSTEPEAPRAPPGGSLGVDLVAYYPLDGDLSDRSFAGHHLSPVSAIGFEEGRVGEALEAQGGQAATLAVRRDAEQGFWLKSPEFTLQAWLFVESGGISLRTLGAGQHWSLGARPHEVIFGNGSAKVTASYPPTPQYRHVIVRRGSDGNVDLFVDANRMDTSNVPIYIGAPAAFTLDMFPIDGPASGAFDEVAIWSRALADQEIAELYNHGSGRSLGP